jgi:hypothetical protein
MAVDARVPLYSIKLSSSRQAARRILLECLCVWSMSCFRFPSLLKETVFYLN